MLPQEILEIFILWNESRAGHLTKKFLARVIKEARLPARFRII